MILPTKTVIIDEKELTQILQDTVIDTVTDCIANYFTFNLNIDFFENISDDVQEEFINKMLGVVGKYFADNYFIEK